MITAINKSPYAIYVYGISYALLLVMNYLDVVFTKSILENGSAVEANPLMDFIIKNYGFDGMLLLKIVFCLPLFIVVAFYDSVSERVVKFYWTAVIIYAILTVYHLLIRAL